MKKKISFLIILISISFFSFSQKIDIRIGGSNLLGKSNAHFSYGLLGDIGFNISKNFSIYSGVEFNSIKYNEIGLVWSDPTGYTGEFSTNHNYTFYSIPLFITYKLISIGNANINGKVGILNSFLYDYYNGNPNVRGHYGNGFEKKGFFLFGLIGLSLDYKLSDKIGIFLTEQYIGSQYYSAHSQYFFNTQIGIKFRMK